MAQWPARRQGFPLLSEGGAAGEAGPSLLLSMDITVLSASHFHRQRDEITHFSGLAEPKLFLCQVTF